MEIDISAAQFNSLDEQYVAAMTRVLLCSDCFTVTLISKCIMLFVLVTFCFCLLLILKLFYLAVLVMLVNCKCYVVSNDMPVVLNVKNVTSVASQLSEALSIHMIACKIILELSLRFFMWKFSAM